MPSSTLEEYLESIYKLSERGPVRPSQVAEALGVSAPTVTATLGRLEKAGLIERPEGGVALTRDGRLQAVSIIRRHRLAEVFLHDVLQLPWDVVHDEACRWEHALSPAVADALEAFLKDPERCPHGHLIPRADGSVSRTEGISLSEAPTGVPYRIAEVDESSGEDFLTYLGRVGLYPAPDVEVIEAARFDGPLTVRVAGEPRAIGMESAARITVVPL